MILLDRRAGVGNLFTDFWNPSVNTSDWAANLYGWLNYGNVPALVRPAAGETPQQIAERQRAAIAAAEASGDWSATPRLGFTASDIADKAKELQDAAALWKWVLIGGALVAGIAVLKVVKR